MKKPLKTLKIRSKRKRIFDNLHLSYSGIIGSGSGGGGLITANNSKGNTIVGIGCEVDNDDGFVQLNDRYGDVGWFKTGKR